MDVSIRRATVDDYDRLNGLYAQLAALHREHLPERFQQPNGPALDRDFWLSRMADANVAWWVMETPADMIGFLHAAIMSPPDIPAIRPRRYVYINDIIVKPEHRGQGLGRQLMAVAEEWAIAAGATSVELGTYNFNTAAIGFYESLGYETLHRRMNKPLPALPASATPI